MKKIVMTLIAAMTLTTAFAAETKTENKNTKTATVEELYKNYNMDVNYDALAHSLRLSNDQREMVELVHDRFIRSVRKAGRATEAERVSKVRKAANTELKNMRYVLNDEQYRKFNTVLNATLVNRGLLN